MDKLSHAQLDQASTRARTRPGQDAECKIYKSAWFRNLPHIPERFFLKDSFHCLYRPGTLPRVSAPSGESEFAASRFWSRAKFGCGNELRDTFGRLFALSCGHRQDFPLVFSASALNYSNFHLRKWSSKRLQNSGHFVPSPMCSYAQSVIPTTTYGGIWYES